MGAYFSVTGCVLLQGRQLRLSLRPGSVSSAPGWLPAAHARPGEAVTLAPRNPLEDAL